MISATRCLKTVPRYRIKEHWPRLRALIEAERVFGMLERSAYALERDVPDEHLAVADRIWFGAGTPLLNARKAWDLMSVEMERWEEELEAERADLCRAILDIALSDIVVQPDKKGQITRIQVSGTSMALSDDQASLLVEGTRFRKDGTAGKRLETIWIDFK